MIERFKNYLPGPHGARCAGQSGGQHSGAWALGNQLTMGRCGSALHGAACPKRGMQRLMGQHAICTGVFQVRTQPKWCEKIASGEKTIEVPREQEKNEWSG